MVICVYADDIEQTQPCSYWPYTPWNSKSSSQWKGKACLQSAETAALAVPRSRMGQHSYQVIAPCLGTILLAWRREPRAPLLLSSRLWGCWEALAQAAWGVAHQHLSGWGGSVPSIPLQQPGLPEARANVTNLVIWA